jgi:hypothetical protein
MLWRVLLIILLIIATLLAGIWAYRNFILPQPTPPVVIIPPPYQPPVPPELPPVLKPVPPAHVAKLLDSVSRQVEVTRSYDPSYVKLKYPGGDVADTTGVCADVLVRAFRTQGVDLQQAIHEDMRKAFTEYPNKWGLKRPDSNIDHRRVYNMMRFFERKGKALPVTQNPADYLPGDVVAWDLGKGQAHIGIVMHHKTEGGVPLIGHNVAYGTNIEDALFFWPIIGHYRYFNEQGDVSATPRDRTTIDLLR